MAGVQVLVFATSLQGLDFSPILFRNFLLDLLADSVGCLLGHYLLILPFVVPEEPRRRGSNERSTYDWTAVAGRPKPKNMLVCVNVCVSLLSELCIGQQLLHHGSLPGLLGNSGMIEVHRIVHHRANLPTHSEHRYDRRCTFPWEESAAGNSPGNIWGIRPCRSSCRTSWSPESLSSAGPSGLLSAPCSVPGLSC